MKESSLREVQGWWYGHLTSELICLFSKYIMK